MDRLIRTLMTCIVALAVQAQGWAATQVRCCGSGHAHEVPVKAPDSADAFATRAGPMAHDHAQANSSHHRPAPNDWPAAHTTVRPDNEGDRSSQHGLPTCGAGAACCAILALPTHVSLPEVFRSSLPPPMAVPISHPSPPPDSLERPPRRALV